ncbi:hypothetical protein [Microvirga terricola]|uniref:Uncharacterized protein n=1 Tax=Microvirga terricola TaxID=2719797 RepID=A0ABX0VE11_9HYPH|nr:hypothetical protein [Microvirga terricola]NIX77733.1 hypothetical protein [Microvirga terricola]
MLLTASEGRHWRYEVCEHADGYLVQMRDLETGALDEDFSTIFRTLPVAFAYAEMSAAFERYAASELEPETIEIGQSEVDLAMTEQHFIDLSDRLHDVGVNGVTVRTWERESERKSTRRLH